MSEDTRIKEFLNYLASLKTIDPLRPKINNNKSNGYEVKYRCCGFRNDSICLAVEIYGSSIVEAECEFAGSWNGLEFKCNQQYYLN